MFLWRGQPQVSFRKGKIFHARHSAQDGKITRLLDGDLQNLLVATAGDTVQDYAEKDNWDLGQIDSNIAAYYTVDGKLHSMPFNSSTPILYYNKDIFKNAGVAEVPKNFQDIISLAPKLTKKDSSGWVNSQPRIFALIRDPNNFSVELPIFIL